MNLLFHYIHDCRWSYGRLLFPTWKKDRHKKLRWVGWFEGYGFRITDKFGFHNCTWTGIY